MGHILLKTACWLGLFVLLMSIGLNALLYRYALRKTRELTSVRQDPLGLASYRQSNGTIGPKAQRQRVVLFGDSRIHQWPDWPVNPALEVLNRGLPGQTTSQILGRVQQDLVELHPDVVVLQMGINDLKAIGLFPAERALIEAACLKNIREVVRQARESRAKVVLLTVFPRGPLEWARRPVWSSEIDQAIAEVNRQLLPDAESGVHVLDCTPLLTREGRWIDEYYVDGLHLTPQGYAAIANSLMPLLDSIVAARESDK